MKRSRSPEAEQEQRSEDESFLKRWTRRKGESAASAGRGQPRQDGPPPAERSDPERDPPVDPEFESRERADLGDARGQEAKGEDAKGDEDMPPLETIDEGGSVAEFFSPRVSQELRRAALRRLFAQPRLPVVDDLDDYAGDYTKFTKLGDLVTNEMRYRVEVARRRLEKRAEQELAASDPEPDARLAQQLPSASDERDDDPVGNLEDHARDNDGPGGELDEQERAEDDRNAD